MIKFLKKISGVQLWLMILLILSGVMIYSEFTAKNTVSTSAETSSAADQSDEPTIEDNYNSSITSSQETNGGAEKATHSLYRVCEDQGVVSVFSDGVAVIRGKVPVSNLPQEDRELLKKGVTFENYGDMIRFIEDYE